MAAKKRKRPDDGLDEVYLGDFEGFVSRRDDLAKRLKADGDADAAEAVKRLKKPSRTAWAVNQFAAHGAKARDELLKAGEDLRAAQEGLVAGDGDREAMIKARDRERAAVDAAVEAIAGLAAEAGPALGDAAAERVRQTLHAVALDDEVRAEFEAARLTTDHEASGLGAAPAGTSKGRTATKREDTAGRRRKELKAAEDDAAKRARELEAAELELREAREAAKRAEGDLKRASRAHEKAQAAAAKADARVAELRSG